MFHVACPCRGGDYPLITLLAAGNTIATEGGLISIYWTGGVLSKGGMIRVCGGHLYEHFECIDSCTLLRKEDEVYVLETTVGGQYS